MLLTRVPASTSGRLRAMLIRLFCSPNTLPRSVSGVSFLNRGLRGDRHKSCADAQDSAEAQGEGQGSPQLAEQHQGPGDGSQACCREPAAAEPMAQLGDHHSSDRHAQSTHGQQGTKA